MDNTPPFDRNDLTAALTEAEKRAQKYAGDLENLRQRYADDLFQERQRSAAQQTELQTLQRAYADLRLQKGGFGFKSLLASGLAATIVAVLGVWVYLRLQPRPEPVVAFENFRREHLFNLEYALSHGQFDAAETTLEQATHDTHYTAIKPQIDFSHKIVKAAKRGCNE